MQQHHYKVFQTDLLSKWMLLTNETKEMLDLMNQFDTSQKTNSVFSFWRSYMNLAGTALSFIWALREGNWDAHQQVVKEMLTFFFVKNQTNYAQWGMVS